VGQEPAERAALDTGAAAALVVRPERIRIIGGSDEVPPGANAVEAAVVDVLYLGSDRKYGLTLPDGQLAAVREPRDGDERQWQRGDPVRLTWSIDDGVLVADPAG
jgi:ABC-type Fe3+/spermidine/putrescine transport system ATPase subunit